MPEPTTTDPALLTVLERARAVGFLGSGPLRVHLEHARAFRIGFPPTARRLLDLGSGGGVPGLPLLTADPELTGVLLDASRNRGAFLTWAVAHLDLTSRVSVRIGRAEELAHDPELRGAFDVVVSRSFGRPATTVECGVGFLRPGGRLLVSEPPTDRSWPLDPLAAVGLRPIELAPSSHRVVGFELTETPPATIPRPIKQQRAEPLF